MQNNNVIAHIDTFQPWSEDRLWQAVDQVSQETGFIAGGEVQRRFIYDRAKTWRVRVEGLLAGTRVSLRIECLKLETDEEEIRRAFRAQASGTRVRPPRTIAHHPFDDAREYAWSLDELVETAPLFQPGDLPEVATAAFVPFYRELRSTVCSPFWPAPSVDAAAFSRKQFTDWRALAQKLYPADVPRHGDLLDRLERTVLTQVDGWPLEFRHAHLAGGDVRVLEDVWVVFANHFWSWRQPGYDLAFAIWNQWMALPAERRTPRGVEDVSETWLDAIRSSCADLADERDVRTMLLNRCFGSLMLDIPAKRSRHADHEITAWDAAVVAEAERLLAV